MSNTVINFNTDPKLKREAMKTAEEMGLTLSIVINNSLRKFVADKRMEFAVPEVPNAILRKAIREAEKEIKSGKLKLYKTHEDFEKALQS